MDDKKKIELLAKAKDAETVKEIVDSIEELAGIAVEDMRADGRDDEANVLLDEIRKIKESNSAIDESIYDNIGSVKGLMKDFENKPKPNESITFKLKHTRGGIEVDASDVKGASTEELLSVALSTIRLLSLKTGHSTGDVVKSIKINLFANEMD